MKDETQTDLTAILHALVGIETQLQAIVRELQAIRKKPTLADELATQRSVRAGVDG